jgi:hypothetical protein
MFKACKRNAKAEPLNFPNPSRSYDETRHGVRFWGYDRTLEISFLIEDGALSKVSPETSANEAGFLNTFDVNRNRICAVAWDIYSRDRKTSYIYSYILTDSDF